MCFVSPNVSCDLLFPFHLQGTRTQSQASEFSTYSNVRYVCMRVCARVQMYARVDQTKPRSGVISWRRNTPLLRKAISLGWSLPSRFGQGISLLLNPGPGIINMLYHNTCVSHKSVRDQLTSLSLQEDYLTDLAIS